MKLVVSFLLSSAVAIGGCSSATQTGTDENDLKGVHCDPLLCKSGEHFSEKKCKCVADCTEMWMCTANEHWDKDACKCVADCTEIWACIPSDHWDADQCQCVPNLAPASN